MKSLNRISVLIAALLLKATAAIAQTATGGPGAISNATCRLPSVAQLEKTFAANAKDAATQACGTSCSLINVRAIIRVPNPAPTFTTYVNDGNFTASTSFPGCGGPSPSGGGDCTAQPVDQPGLNSVSVSINSSASSIAPQSCSVTATLELVTTGKDADGFALHPETTQNTFTLTGILY